MLAAMTAAPLWGFLVYGPDAVFDTSILRSVKFEGSGLAGMA